MSPSEKQAYMKCFISLSTAISGALLFGIQNAAIEDLEKFSLTYLNEQNKQSLASKEQTVKE